MQKTLVANIYNPHEQSKEEIIESFVVRHKLFNKLFREIKRTDMQYPEQHFLIEGQRGMGKTTLLLRLSYEIENDNALNTWLIPVVLKEEAYYGITRLFKLWETLAEMLADRDSTFAGLYEQMENAYDENSDYERICFELLVNALEKQAKKIILFIDNVGEMFKIFGEKESHRLREVLMTCAHLRIVGATAITLEASFKYEHAFYEFFKKETLAGLNKEETRRLLLQLAKNYHTENAIQSIIENQPGRVDSLRILTGGVIRTVILLFEIFIDNKNGNAINDLDNVLDRVTPLYKHRMDDLTPLQREVVHAIALNWDAISPDDIARKTRLKMDDVSAQLGVLETVFIVQRAATDTQTHLYYLNERFFNIWYLMRLTSKGNQNKVIWLVRFLEFWYNKDELNQRAKKHIETLSKGDYYPKAAYYMTEALARTAKLDMETEHELFSTTKNFLTETDKSLLAELSTSDKDLLEKCKKYFSNKKYQQCFSLSSKIKNEALRNIILGVIYVNFFSGNKKLLKKLSMFEFAGIDKSLLTTSDKELVEEGKKYFDDKKYQQSFSSFSKIKEDTLRYNTILRLIYVGSIMSLLEQFSISEKELFEEYKKYFDYKKYQQSFSLVFTKYEALRDTNLGFFHVILKDYAKAEKYYLMAVDKQDANAMNNLGLLYEELKDYAKAEKYYLMAVEQENTLAMYNLGLLYQNELKNYTKAEKYFLMAVEKQHADAMNNIGLLYRNELKDYAKAEKYFLMAVDKQNASAMNNLGILYLDKLKDYAKAEKYFLMAVEKEFPEAMNSLAWLYFAQKINKEEALKYGKQAVEKNNSIFTTHTLACIYLWNNEIEQAIQVAKQFMYKPESYEQFEEYIILYLMLLIAKQQYQHATVYFNETPDLNLKDRFKPLYYALLYFTGDKDYNKCPPEITEPVNEIIDKIKQMALDYS